MRRAPQYVVGEGPLPGVGRARKDQRRAAVGRSTATCRVKYAPACRAEQRSVSRRPKPRNGAIRCATRPCCAYLQAPNDPSVLNPPHLRLALGGAGDEHGGVGPWTSKKPSVSFIGTT